MLGVKMCPRKQLRKSWNMLTNLTSTIMNQNDGCPVPCQFTFLTMDHVPSLPNSNNTRTFTFTVHPVATLTRSSLVYTLESFVGEFGGWVGLFIGVCVSDLFDYGWDGLITAWRFI